MFELFVSDYIRSVWLQSVFVSNEYAEVIGCNNINRGRRIRTMKVQKLYLLVKVLNITLAPHFIWKPEIHNAIVYRVEARITICSNRISMTLNISR
jgi:hypothetical protein